MVNTNPIINNIVFMIVPLFFIYSCFIIYFILCKMGLFLYSKYFSFEFLFFSKGIFKIQGDFSLNFKNLQKKRNSLNITLLKNFSLCTYCITYHFLLQSLKFLLFLFFYFLFELFFLFYLFFLFFPLYFLFSYEKR